jgi:hypothetical protein
MRNELKQLRAIRREMETLRPQTGPAKWQQIYRSLRVAGQPRSVSAAIRVVILTDLIADTEVDDQNKATARVALEQYKRCAAYKEKAWLNKDQLDDFLRRYRKNGYRQTQLEKWTEDRTKNPYPYCDKV